MAYRSARSVALSLKEGTRRRAIRPPLRETNGRWRRLRSVMGGGRPWIATSGWVGVVGLVIGRLII